MPLLHQEPPTRIDTLDDLLGLAMAMETEAVRRYEQLAAIMEQRGDTGTAAAFRSLKAEEERHTAAVGHWAETLGRAAPDGAVFLWVLPPDIASSWDDLLDRTRLTPYRALSLAVVNEQRAFSFYSHVAAATGDDAVRTHVETLAREELQHAALLRRERRKAFHRGDARDGGGRGGMETPARADTPAALDRIAHGLLSDAAATHAALSRRLAVGGDTAGSALLARIAQEEETLAGAPAAAHPPLVDEAASPWSAAIATVETLAESFADIAATTGDETVLAKAITLQEAAIRHLASLTAFRQP
ncbi:ferritin-like domain-containing protein [Azospirillum doebereinerae]